MALGIGGINTCFRYISKGLELPAGSAKSQDTWEKGLGKGRGH